MAIAGGGIGPTGLGGIERVFRKIMEIQDRFQAIESVVMDAVPDDHLKPKDSRLTDGQASFRSALDQAKERQSTDGKNESTAVAPQSGASTSAKLTASSAPTGAKDGSLEKRLMETLRRELPKSNVPADLALALMQVESNFNSKAVSPKGAMGVMQLMPSTAAELGVADSADLFQPEVNVPTGLQYLSKLLNKYGGDEQKALAAYNAGPANVDKYGGVPPFPETRNYLKKVLEVRRQLNESASSFDEPSL